VIIFCETGLVVTPILPGDSLLFAVGALCALQPDALDIRLVIPLLIAAAVLGDAVNYSIGLRIGPRAFRSDSSRLLNKKHLVRTQAFYEKHGGKTIILARFAPIIRTFAPFVAGIGRMPYARFFSFNVVGAIAWVSIGTVAGYLFGNFPVVKKNFSLVIIAIVVVSVLPLVVEFWRSRSRGSGEPAAKKAVADAPDAPDAPAGG
jgi:membrane-associated protein